MTALTTPNRVTTSSSQSADLPRVPKSSIAIVGATPMGEALGARLGLVPRGVSSERLWDAHDWNGPECFILAVDAPQLPRVLTELGQRRTRKASILQVARGLAPDGACLGEVAARLLGERLNTHAALLGGCTARDFASATPTRATLACADEAMSRAIGAHFVDTALHVRLTTDVQGTEWAAAFGEVLAFLAGLADSADFEAGTRTWVLAAASDEIVALAERELRVSGRDFASRAGPWPTEFLAALVQEGPSRSFGRLLGRGFSVDDAVEQVAERSAGDGRREMSRDNIPAISTLQGALSRGYTRDCPGLAALCDLVVHASSARELWQRLLHRSLPTIDEGMGATA